jgi:antitoxin HicB
MPKTIRELKAILLKAGFFYVPAKGSHGKWRHPNLAQSIIIADKDGGEIMNYHYTIKIQWSDEDRCFVVFLPDFTNVMQSCTHGDTYEAALSNAQEVLEMLIEGAIADGETLPSPQTFKPIATLAAA